MFYLTLDQSQKQVKSILLIGAHCDDIEIGCGATVLYLTEKYPDAHYYWLVLTSNKTRAEEAQKSAKSFLATVNNITIDIQSFRNGYLPYVGAEVKDYFEALKSRVSPDIIFTHYRNDYHQDHRVASELTWNTFRDHLIFEYEIPKYDGGMGSPNTFFPVTHQHCETKIEKLLQFFASERNKGWFTEETFRGLMRLRGVECNATNGYAEAFYTRKNVFSP